MQLNVHEVLYQSDSIRVKTKQEWNNRKGSS